MVENDRWISTPRNALSAVFDAALIHAISERDLCKASNAVNMAQADKRIPVREETFDHLGEFKGAGETWDDVLNELIRARQEQNLRDLLDRTEDDEFVPLEDV